MRVGQHGRRARLGQHVHLLAHGLLQAHRVAGHQHHRHRRIALQQLRGQRDAVDLARHLDVAQHDVDLAADVRRCAAARPAPPSARCTVQPIDSSSSRVACATASLSSTSSSRQCRSCATRRSVRGGVLGRAAALEVQPHARAAARARVDVRRAAGAVAQRLHLAQAQAGALAERLGGEERLEGARRSPPARSPARCRAPRARTNAPAARRRVAGHRVARADVEPPAAAHRVLAR